MDAVRARTENEQDAEREMHTPARAVGRAEKEPVRLTKVQIVFWTLFLLLNLRFVYRFYLAGLPLIPIQSVLLCSAMISYQLRALARPAWLQRTFMAMYWALLASCLAALLFFSR